MNKIKKMFSLLSLFLVVTGCSNNLSDTKIVKGEATSNKLPIATVVKGEATSKTSPITSNSNIVQKITSSGTGSGTPEQIPVNVNKNQLINNNVNPTSSLTLSSPSPPPEYKAAIVSFQSLEIKEIEGNGDNVPNRGESISITPTFINKGGVSSNQLTIELSSKSSFVTITDSNDYILSLKPNAPQKSQGILKLTIDKTVAPNTEITLYFKLTDRFGNEFNTIGSFIIK